MTKDMRELAARYVEKTHAQGVGQLTDTEYLKHWPMIQEMITHEGRDNTEKYIREAREIYKMIHG